MASSTATMVNAPPELHTQSELPSGLRVYLRSDFNSRVLHVGLFVKHGSLHEDRDSSGLAHFIEHVVFNPRYFTPEVTAVYDRLVARGASYEASTTKEYTRFSVFCLPESIHEAVHFLSLLARPQRPSQEAIETERSIVLHERAMTLGSPGPLDTQWLDHAIWGESSLGLFILGREANVRRFTQDDVEERMRAYYVPERMLLGVVGPVAPETLMPRVQQLFGDWSRGQQAIPEPTALAAPRTVALPAQSPRVTLQLGFLGGLGVTLGSEHRLPMELLGDVLGIGPRSRLFVQLRQEKKLAYLAHSTVMTYELGGYLGVYINCDRAAFKECYATVRSTIAELCAQGVGAAELERARLERLVAILDSMEVNRKYLNLVGRRALLGLPFDRDSEPGQIHAVTAGQVDAFARDLLADARPAVVGIGLSEEELAELPL